MEHTLVAVFDSEVHARNALDELAAFGCSRSDMHINAARQSGLTDSTSSTTDISRDEQSVGEKIKAFFYNLFGTGEGAGHADIYSGAIERGNYVLTLTARDDDQVMRATEVLNRHNPIEIEEQLPTGKRTVQHGGVRVFERTADESLQGSTGSTQGSMQGSALGTDDADFRTHWQSSYAQSGGRYEDFAPAYQYGTTLGMDERFRGRQWDEIEPEVRTDWESTHVGSAWEKTKEAVRTGWDKVARKLPG